MKGPWGPVHGPIDLDIDASGVTVLRCPAGSGLRPLTEYIEELTELDGLLLRIVPANTRGPELLVVGNLDQVASDDSRAMLLADRPPFDPMTCAVNGLRQPPSAAPTRGCGSRWRTGRAARGCAGPH
nr:hypothetical protein [Mycolicibacterium tusciae]